MELGPPRTVKEVQSLNGKNRSPKQICLQSDGQMSAILPHSEKIVRVDGRVPEGIQGLKEIPFVPPLLSPSRLGEELYLYIAVSQAVVSAALVREEEGSQQPVYFISRAF